LLDAGAPLPAVFGVAPAVFMAGETSLKAVAERHCAGAFGNALHLVRTRLLPSRKRVDAVQELLAQGARLDPRIGKANGVARPQANRRAAGRDIRNEPPMTD